MSSSWSSSSSSSDVNLRSSSSSSLHRLSVGASRTPKSQILITLPPSFVSNSLTVRSLFNLYAKFYSRASTRRARNCFISDRTSSLSNCPFRLYKSPPSASSKDKYTSKLVATNFPPINFLAPVVAGLTNTSNSSATFGCALVEQQFPAAFVSRSVSNTARSRFVSARRTSLSYRTL